MIDWQYSESIESPDIVSIKKKYSNYIGGKFAEPKSKKYINTISPSTEELLSKVPLSNEKDINSACLLYTSPSPRDMRRSRMPSSA